MSSKNFFSQMNIAGMGISLSQSKLSKAMLEILLQLPAGTTNLKEVIVANMGLIDLMSTTRDINTAWNQTKKSVVKLYPDKFIMDNRNILQKRKCKIISCCQSVFKAIHKNGNYAYWPDESTIHRGSSRRSIISSCSFGNVRY